MSFLYDLVIRKYRVRKIGPDLAGEGLNRILEIDYYFDLPLLPFIMMPSSQSRIRAFDIRIAPI